MISRILIALIIVAVPLCSLAAAHAPQFTFDDLFHIDAASARIAYGIAASGALREALDDFNAVLAGAQPRHARFDRGRPLLADGGTKYYKGRGYKLTIVKSLNGMFHGKTYISGYVYGPVIDFDSSVMAGNAPSISYLTFYPDETLRALLGDRL